MSIISRSRNLFVIFYCTYMCSLSASESSSYYPNIEQSDNQRRRALTPRSIPIACRVCDKIFLDNVSLVLHFECHIEDEFPTSEQHSRTLAPLQNDRLVSFDSSQVSHSFIERPSEDRQIKVPRTDGYSRPSFQSNRPVSFNSSQVSSSFVGRPSEAIQVSTPCSLPVSSAKTNVLPRDVSPAQISVLNSMPPLISSIDAQRKSSQSTARSTRRQKATTSPLSHPLFYSQSSSSRGARGVAAIPVQLNEQIVGRAVYRKPQIKQSEMPCKEIIIISEDEEGDNDGPMEMLDLTLKL